MTNVIELRRYRLHPGQRDVLIDLFDKKFVESQEALGMPILGQFRDLDEPDRFVWIRGFPDMASRGERLAAFYTGPVWKAHSARANATMIDVDDVLLLRPAGPSTGFALDPAVRDLPATSFVVATIYHLPAPVDESFVRLFQRAAADLKPLAQLCTEYAENNFPALPVRTGEHVFVWFASVPTLAQAREFPELRMPASQERLILEPTARSLLR